MAEAEGTGQVRGGVAERYANALYNLAAEQGALDSVVADMATLGRLMAESADLRRLFDSPLLDKAHVSGALIAVLNAQQIGKPTRDFVGVVASNRRLHDMRRIVATFAALVAQRRGVVVADVASAHPLSDVQRQQLRARLIEAGYGNVDLRETVDAALLGGLTVRIGARLYDTSIKSRLQRLSYALKGAA